MRIFIATAVMAVCAGVPGVPSAVGQAVAAPSGVSLQVAETAVDLSRPSAVELHLQVVNSSGQTLRVWPGTPSVLAVGPGGQEHRCADLPNVSARPDASPQALRPGGSLAETLTFNADVCNGLRQAKAIKVQRVMFAANDNTVSLVSQPIPVRSGGLPADASAAAIQTMLQKQAEDWNRGDLDAFASGYKNSADILFIGKTISRGYDGMLATYKRNYPTHEAMGTLTFSGLEVQPLDLKFATVTGRFHLERTAAGGGQAEGFFLLVVEDTAGGWKIVRDDTTATAAPSASSRH
jgi:ketosteroid isomerase-like protein